MDQKLILMLAVQINEIFITV